MPRTRTRTQLNRYRYELAAAILLTVSALGFLALAALNNEQENWPVQVKIQSPGQHPQQATTPELPHHHQVNHGAPSGEAENALVAAQLLLQNQLSLKPFGTHQPAN